MPDLLERYFIPQRFSFQGLSIAAGLSGLAYSLVGSWLQGLARSLNCRSATVDGEVDVTSPRMLTLDHPRMKVFVIRGTDNLAQLRSYMFDSEIVILPDQESWSAPFFTVAADDIYRRIRAIPGGPYSCVLIGHSLGGAVATLVAPRLARAGWNVYGVWSVGSPKPADETFARGYRIPHWRAVDSNDPVSYLPIIGISALNLLSTLAFGVALLQTPNWSHCGQPYTLDQHTYPDDVAGQAEHIREFVAWTQDHFRERHGIERYIRLAVHRVRDAYRLEMGAFNQVLREQGYDVRA